MTKMDFRATIGHRDLSVAQSTCYISIGVGHLLMGEHCILVAFKDRVEMTQEIPMTTLLAS